MKRLLPIILALFAILVGGFVWWIRTDLNHHLDNLSENMPYSAVRQILPQRIISRDLEEMPPYRLMNGTEVRQFQMVLAAGEHTAVLTFDSSTNLISFPQKVRQTLATNPPPTGGEP
ncbi:MAG: hypothetical protein IK066_07870 [Kiritimatiellae bacterium]|nr:hypothetical protein [Kiritimatiellia bacterium]